MYNKISEYIFDLITTSNCNLRCEYCTQIKEKKYLSLDTLNTFFDRIENLRKNPEFRKDYNTIRFGFWGGEPTLNKDVIYETVNRYLDDEEISFHLITNGYKISHLLNLLETCKKRNTITRNPKMLTQVSFDGILVHDKRRKTENNKVSTDDVIETIIELAEKKIPFGTKSTITFDDIEYLFENYVTYNQLIQKINKKYKLKLNYGVTIDYKNENVYSEEEIKRYNELLEKNIKQCLEYSKKEKDAVYFNLINKNVRLCSVGLNISALDTDGKIYKCHNCTFSNNKTDHLVTDVWDTYFEQKIIDTIKLHRKLFNLVPVECKKCNPVVCYRCNVVVYDISKKDDYVKRWVDYPASKYVCEFYKTISKVLREN